MNAIEEKIEELREAVEDEDYERSHCVYDEILYILAMKQDEAIIDKIDDITEDAQFWYA